MKKFKKIRLLLAAGFILCAPLFAQPPADWSVNPSAYEHMLTVTARLDIAGQLAADENDVIGAFAGGECRGVAAAVPVPDGWLYFLMVRANGGGETITFQVWDADLDTVISSENQIVFTPDLAFGSVDDPYLLAATNNFTFIDVFDDAAETDEDVELVLNPLANDTADLQSQPFVTILSGPYHGSAIADSNGLITYTPSDNYFGPDSLVYQAENPWCSDSGVVLISVLPVNDPPVLAAIEDQETGADTALEIILSGSDRDNVSLVYSAFSDTTGVLAEVNDTVLTLIPQAEFSGTANILVTVSDGAASDSTAFTLTVITVSIDDEPGLPAEFALEQNYPNPFNPVTAIDYYLPVKSGVTITVYDMLGKEVANLVSGTQEAGYKSVQWNAINMSSGMYFYSIEAGVFFQTRKMVLLK